MKKVFALIVCLLYLLSSNICYAFSELYSLKNTNKNTLTEYLTSILTDKNYTIQKSNPIYALSNKNDTYIVIVLETFGNNVLYYYESNNDKKLNKNILKKFDSVNIIYEKSYNEVSLNRLSEVAQRTISGEKTTYSFDDQTLAQTPQQSVQKAKVPATTLKGTVQHVAKGSAFQVYLQNPINTATAAIGDQVIGVLKDDWTLDNYHIIAEKGSVIYGTLTKAEHARRGLRNGEVQIDFSKLDTPNGKTYDLKTQKIDFEVTDEGKLRSTMTNVAATAAIGALIGLSLALLGGNGHYGMDAAIGAGAAGGIALATQVAQRGVDAEIPSYTELEVVLDSDISVIIY